MSKRILKRWGMFAKRPGWMKRKKTGMENNTMKQNKTIVPI
jgi:hypothetical protein